MAFDPLDPTTWHDDPDDFVVPAHERESVALAQHLTTQADADEEAQVRAFLGLDRWDMSEEDKQELLRQVMEGRRAIHEALENLVEAEEALSDPDQERAKQDADDAMAMTDDDVADEMRRRAGWDQEEV